MDNPLRLVLSLAALGVSCIFHEQWHARSALWLGDPTGKSDKRLSWNPVHHVDPFMTLILPVILLLGSGGRFAFGGAKPVSINPMNFRNPSLGLCLSSAAGPLSNFFLALVTFGVFAVLYAAAPKLLISGETVTWNAIFLGQLFFINLLLGSFNILPLPGLDGSRILRHFAPRNLQLFLDSIEPFALPITMVLVMLGATRGLGNVLSLAFEVLASATSFEFVQALVLGLWH